jgi:lysophospholipase L1-like esterase
MKKIFYIFIFLCSYCFSSEIVLNKVEVNKTSFNSEYKKQLLALGDSITYNEDYSWRYKLQDLIGISAYNWIGTYSGSNSSYQVRFSALGGDTTAIVLSRLTTNEIPVSFINNTDDSIVLIYIGVNDLRGTVDHDVSVTNIQSMLTAIHAVNQNVGIYVSLIFPWSGDTDYAETIDFNSKLHTMLETYKLTNSNVFEVDMYTPFVSNVNWIADYTTDGIHPNSAGNQIMANALHTAIDANEAS